MNNQSTFAPTAPVKSHLLTVMLEDYFHVGALDQVIGQGKWERFESRFEQNTIKMLDLLSRFDITATFFVLGWIAERQPELIREVARRGHEIASRGYYHRPLRDMTPAEFRADLMRARDAIERATGSEVHGYRAAARLHAPVDSWALDVLAEEGYKYDSSFVPAARTPRGEASRFAHTHGGKELWEFPVSTFNLLGYSLPIAGGNFFRQIPHTLLRHAVEHWHHTYDAPFVMYTHVWELDPEQPRISAASPLTRLRHYRKLDKMQWVLEYYFGKYHFTSVAEHLGLAAAPRTDLTSQEEPPRVAASAPVNQTATADPEAATRRPVSIVVPCYNEAATLPYLSNTLRGMEASLRQDYDLRFIFVDDGSTDETWDKLQEVFGAKPCYTLLRHERNRGVAAAILTGVRHAETEVVCSMDCDCTYDPLELRHMIPLLTDGVDMVTASPYHPRGRVLNVPGWRLKLSQAASHLYRQVLRQKLHTYTSCFRVYRRSAVAGLVVQEQGFLGVTELLGLLDLNDSVIVEHPATLEVRLFGQSKMKVLRTIGGHLRLLTRLTRMRIRRGRSDAGSKIADPASTVADNLSTDGQLDSAVHAQFTLPQE